MKAVILCISLYVSYVHGHGFVSSPRSRNFVAAEDGVWSGGAPTLPAKENCPSCANRKAGAHEYCGTVDGRNYDFPLDQSGNPLAPQAQAVYTEGDIIDMEFVFTANHNGHHVTRGCADFHNPSKECFDQNVLEFVEDVSVQAFGTSENAPKDPNYPERGYVNRAASHTRMRFKLPEGLYGDLVLLQWHWVTGNSCRSAGYDEYPWPPAWEPSNMGPCPDYDDLDPQGIGQPEQFWNCIEVKILPKQTYPTVSPSPTNMPLVGVTPAPVEPITPAPLSTSTQAPVPAPNSDACCSMNFKDCDSDWCGDTEEKCLSCGSPGDKTWLPTGPRTECIARWGACTTDIDGCCEPAVCVGNESYRQCLPGPSNPPPTNPTNPTPTPPVAPVTNAPYASTSAPVVPGSNRLFSTSQTMTSYEALLQLDSITKKISDFPPIYSIISEGGAAGSGDVVSEGQGYGLMVAGITLAAMPPTDPNREDVLNRFYGYFLGWKQMCINSTPKSFCQAHKLCNGGTVPCLPGWKHDADLTTVIGTGAAPDGDADAITGMIFAIQSLETFASKPTWYDEVRQWADASSTSFLYYNTKPSKTGSAHRIVRLGSCWGGWETEGNNPSYHSPGSMRLMKKFQKTVKDGERDYIMPNFNDGISLEERWDITINTSYDFLEATQCPIGIFPNWAMVTETSGNIEYYPGPFSGSGTPQYQFGSEASRTLWRTVFDVAVFPNEAYERASVLLDKIHGSLESGFDGNDWTDNTLTPCTGVTSVFPGWRHNAFIYSPVYTTLVLQGDMDDTLQQSMVDTAGTLVNNISPGTSYYSLCWSVIGILTLNGDVEQAARNLFGTDPPTLAPTVDSTIVPQWNLLFEEGFEEDLGIFNKGGNDAKRFYAETIKKKKAKNSLGSIQLQDNSGTKSSVYSEWIDVSSFTQLKVEFWYIVHKFKAGEDFMLEYKTQNGPSPSWNLQKSFIYQTDFGSLRKWYKATQVMDTSDVTEIKIRFRCDASSNRDKVFLDDVKIYGWG